jgi:translocation and assembly module TamA
MHLSLRNKWIFTLMALCCCLRAAYAADSQSYRVYFASTGDRTMDATLKATSELESLRSSAPVDLVGLVARARGDVARLKTVLESFGFYQSSVAITINGMGLDTSSLAEAASATAGSKDARVAISFKTGPLYHLRRVDVKGDLPASVRGALGLASGAPAVAANVLAAGARLQTALEDQGYAFAKVDPPIAHEDPASQVLDVSFQVAPGSRVQIGDIRIEGLKLVHEQLVRSRLTVHTGEQYSASKIEQARKDLQGLGVFGAISVEVGKTADSLGRVPITFHMRERLRHAVTINAAYSSDLGGSSGVTWGNRNVFGNAEQLNLSAQIINLGGGTDTTGLGYDATAKYILPEFGHRDQALQFSLGALKQFLQAYDQTAGTAGVTLSRKFSSTWSGSVGLSVTQERVLQEGVTLNYTLVALPLNVLFNSTDLASPLDDPRHGMRAALTVTPTRSLGQPSATFIINQATIAQYFDLHLLGWSDPGRSVLALRALAGVAQGAGEFSLPPDQRFYGGGSGTIRGYRYQSVSPLFPYSTEFPDQNPIGGTAISAGTAEFRQRIGENYGAAFFLDGGQVSTNLQPFSGDFRLGIGGGVRYYTGIGPIRLDVALPLDRRPTDDAFEVYIGLGQAF